MKAIVAVDKNWGIGNKGKLLVSIPDDLKHFKNLTMGGTVIYGRQTLETFPKQKPLPGRRNIILSRDFSFVAQGAEIAHNSSELLKFIKDIPSKDVWLIGGASVYLQYIDMCDEAVVTYINNEYEADVYFPNLDAQPDWKLADESDVMTYNDINYTFRTYRRL